MIQMINKLKKNQKGFTLVELIVVLVILAILAAFTIPAMLGFVGDARAKAEIANAREVYVAAQAAASEQMSTTNTPPAWSDVANDPFPKAVQNYLASDITIIPVASDANVNAQFKVFVEVGADGKVAKVVYGGAADNITITAGTTGNGTEITKRTT
ncbi:type II secretion system protein [Eubacterium maltosivorans]|uniref:type II secretion system protein n=1 Tax=Eubacterium maltosivorans TaxID=2041044 RepID=UPI003A941B82